MAALDPALLEQAAGLYGLPHDALRPLAGGHFSHVYEGVRGGRGFVLRITPPDEELNFESLRAILAWMDYLAQKGGPVAAPIRSTRGNLLETARDPGGPYIVTGIEKARGVLAETLPFEAWSPDLCRSIGRAVGRLHALSRSYAPADQGPLRPGWDQVTNCFNPSEALDELHLVIRQKREQVLEAVRRLPLDGPGYGLIHSDLHLANFFVELRSNTVTLFDFDDCCYGWFIMDLALPLLDFSVVYSRQAPQDSAANFFLNFWQGYRLENSLSAFWLEQLPLILKLLEIGLYSAVQGIYDPGHPETWVGKFMSERRSRIERDVPTVALDFAELAEEIPFA